MTEAVVHRERGLNPGDKTTVIALQPTRSEWEANFKKGAAGVLLTDGRIVIGDGNCLAHDVILDYAGVDQNLEAYRLQLSPKGVYVELWIHDHDDSKPFDPTVVEAQYGETIEEIEAKVRRAVSRFLGSAPVKAIPLDIDTQYAMTPDGDAFRNSCWER